MSKIEFRNATWRLTKAGLEHVKRGYFIARDRMLEERMGAPLYDWPLHMAIKDWCNIADFCEAWTVAASQEEDFDEGMWSRSVTAAYKASARALIFERINRRMFPPKIEALHFEEFSARVVAVNTEMARHLSAEAPTVGP